MANLNRTLGNSIKDCISFFFVCVEGFVLDVPWKELISAPFVKRFKAATLRRSH